MTPPPAPVRILEAAERLFAEFGIEAVSLRQIAAAAGQRNTSAVAYHYGSKQGLVEALYGWRMTPVNARRLELLAAVRAPTVESYVRALVQPLVETLAEAEAAGRPSWYLRFLAEAMRYPEYDPEAVALGRPEAESIRDLIHGLVAQTAPLGVPPAVFRQRMRLLTLLVITSLADRERLGPAERDTAVGTEILISAGTAILSASTGPATPAVPAPIPAPIRHSANGIPPWASMPPSKSC
jgi:AcrR family transcriptional regulator